MDIRFSDIVPIIVALISLIGAIITRGKIKISATLGIAAIILTILVMVSITQRQAQTTATITFPSANDIVDQSLFVKGASRNLPSDSHLWLVIYPQTVARYYPQSFPVDIQVNGNWSGLAGVGGDNGDSGKIFDILVVGLDNDADLQMKNLLAQKDWSGLVTLPKKAAIYDRVSVMRK